MNVTLSGNKVFADVIKMSGPFSTVTDVLIKRGKYEHAPRRTVCGM